MPCLICNGDVKHVASIPFMKSCEEGSMDGERIDYVRCVDCGHVHAPSMCDKPPEWFSEHIYNADYVKFDPEYMGIRAERQAKNLVYAFSWARKRIQHLDYGGGDGRLSVMMASKGFDSATYDPFVDDSMVMGSFNLITAFEVLEHVPDPHGAMATIASMLDDDGMLIASTELNDHHDIGTWWYAAPRNGHISLFSTESLGRLALKHGLQARIASNGTHMFFRNLPDWFL